ncbi:MAG TPA: metallophosphoesterase [Candidatus Nanoarchaeia archaeon]|nr:metallophosphoesterase [Candidatus Nanoarchaeia archaeon]
MKILAFVDTHGNNRALKSVTEKAGSADILICAGDVSVFEQDLDKIMKKLDRIGKPVLIIPGNHESEKSLKSLCKKTKNIVYMHKGMLRLKDITFIGFAGDGFSLTDPEFERWGNKIQPHLKKKDKVVLITHAPPHKTKLDVIMGSHTGSKSIRKFIEKVDLVLAIAGHIHENAGAEDMIKGTKVVNPGPYGKVYEV